MGFSLGRRFIERCGRKTGRGFTAFGWEEEGEESISWDRDAEIISWTGREGSGRCGYGWEYEKGEKMLQPSLNDSRVSWVKSSIFLSPFKVERNEEGGIAIKTHSYMKTPYLKWDESGKVFVWNSAPTFLEEGKDFVFVPHKGFALILSIVT